MLTFVGLMLTVVLTLKLLVINNVDIVDTFPRIRHFMSHDTKLLSEGHKFPLTRPTDTLSMNRPLTPTLSPDGEEGGVSPGEGDWGSWSRCVIRESLKLPMNLSNRPTFQAICVLFSLSQRERAGVRESRSNQDPASVYGVRGQFMVYPMAPLFAATAKKYVAN